MQNNCVLYNLVYDYYETRIRFGFYKNGEKLPSIPKISRIFHLAPATVRAGLAALAKDGYIKTGPRKTAEVIYQASPSGLRRNAAEYFIPRREGIRDISRSGGYLLEPLWKEGLRQRDEKDWEALKNGFLNHSSDRASVPVEFYLWAVGALDNRLALNLLWEIVRYLRFPYLVNHMDAFHSPGEAVLAAPEDTIAFLRQESARSFAASSERLYAFIGEAQKEYSLDSLEPVPFRWSIYRQRPQLRYSLACRIIREILHGKYPPGSYLPSLSQMVSQYGITLMTVRRTMELLEDIGITLSFQGKGTQVRLQPAPANFSSSSVQEGLRLCRDSLQLLRLTLSPIAVLTLEAAREERLETFGRTLARIQSEKKSFLCFDVFLSFLVEQCPLAAVRECYGQLQSLLLWGYPFALSQQGLSGLEKQYAPAVRQMEQALSLRDFSSFSAVWDCILLEGEKRICSFLS